MERIIHIQTKKITSHDENGNPNVETSLVKLIDHLEYLKLNNKSSFSKFVNIMNANRYKETPVVIAVIDLKTMKHIDKKDYQNVIDKMASEGKSNKKVDNKKLSENQAIEIDKMKTDFEKRFEALERKPIKIKKDFKEKIIEAKVKQKSNK